MCIARGHVFWLTRFVEKIMTTLLPWEGCFCIVNRNVNLKEIALLVTKTECVRSLGCHFCQLFRLLFKIC